MRKRILSLTVVFAMILTFIPAFSLTASAAEFVGSGGNGTEDEPYLISNLDDLEAFRDYINADADGGKDEYFKLTANIDMSDKYSSGGTSWTPIGREDNPFSGTFDGGGFEISRLYISTTDDYQGLFGYSTGTIKNLTVSGSVAGSDNSGIVGGIVGYNAGGSIINCHNEATITAPAVDIGGIVGWNAGGSIENCYNAGAVESKSNRIGGIVGYDNSNSAALKIAITRER